jgi:hypothetical protein
MNCLCQRHEGERLFSKFMIENYREIKVKAINGAALSLLGNICRTVLITSIDFS